MTVQCAWKGRVFRRVQGANAPRCSRAPMCSRVVLSEVQITGIPKASILEVASTA
jgi:hypothetical protein